MSEVQRENFLCQGRILRLATFGESIHVVPIWYVYEGRKVYIFTRADSIKVRDIEKNNKVAMCVDVGESYHDLKNVKMSGIAHVLADKDLGRQIAEKIMVKYLGSSTHPTSEKYLSEEFPWVVVEIEIIKSSSEDYGLLA